MTGSPDEGTPAAAAANGGGTAKMQTIAEHLGISIATVSRSLRRVPGINAETRARVLATAAQLGYQLPQTHRLQEQRELGNLEHIGVLIQTPQAQAAAPLYLVGMSEAAMGLNASLIVHYASPEGCARLAETRFQPRAMQSGLVSGVVFVFRWPAEVVREISRNYRAVSILYRYPGMDMVGVDNQGGVELLAAHLHGLGHRRIGFLGHCPEMHWTTERFGGYVAALSRLGIAYEPTWVIEVEAAALTEAQPAAEKSLAEAERLARENGVRAWICSTELVGQQLHAWMTAHGLRVPEDVSVTGFHRSGMAAGAGQADLTSVGASFQAMGAAALKRLLYRMRNPAESTRHILFPFELYNGRSVAPPPPQLPQLEARSRRASTSTFSETI